MANGSLSSANGAVELPDAGPRAGEPVTSEPDKTPDAFLLAPSATSGSVPELMAKLLGGFKNVCRTAGADARFCSASAPEAATVFDMLVVFASDDFPGAAGCFVGSAGVSGKGEPGVGSVKTRGDVVGPSGGGPPWSSICDTTRKPPTTMATTAAATNKVRSRSESFFEPLGVTVPGITLNLSFGDVAAAAWAARRAAAMKSALPPAGSGMTGGFAGDAESQAAKRLTRLLAPRGGVG